MTPCHKTSRTAQSSQKVRKLVSIDVGALCEVAQILNTTTMSETVDSALREIIALHLAGDRSYSRLVDSRDVPPSIAELLAVRGRPVTEAGLTRARQRLAAADERRDPARRERLRRQLSQPDAEA